MATEIDGAPVETAPATTSSAPAAPESSAVVTSPSSPSTAEMLAESLAEFHTHYESPMEAAARARQAAEAAPAPAAEQPAAVEPPEDEPTPSGELPKQVRPRMTAPEDIAIAGIQRARGCTFAEAAKILFAGTATQQPIAAAEPTPAQPVPAAPPASLTLQGQIDALAAEMKTDRDSDNHLTGEYAEKIERLTDLKNELRFVREQEGQEVAARQQSQAREADQARNASYIAARTEFPSTANPASPLRQVIAAIEAQWAANPATVGRLDRTDAPQMLVREAAERVATGLVNAGSFRTLDQALASLKAPAAAPAAAAPAYAAPPVAPQPSRRVTAAAGSKGQARDDQPSSLNAAMAAVTTAKEGNELLRQLYGEGPLML